jgi:hypothetical protein
MAYTGYMNKTTSNPYAQQILAKGRDLPTAPAKGRQFPCEIHGRRFETKEQYDDAMADFLNGM